MGLVKVLARAPRAVPDGFIGVVAEMGVPFFGRGGGLSFRGVDDAWFRTVLVLLEASTPLLIILADSGDAFSTFWEGRTSLTGDLKGFWKGDRNGLLSCAAASTRRRLGKGVDIFRLF